MWRELNASHQRQVDDLLHHSAASSSPAASDVVLSQLSLLEMGRAMRVRRITRQRVQSMQSEVTRRTMRRCWYAWAQCVWQRADAVTRADEWRRGRRQREVMLLGRQYVRRWKARAADRRHGEQLSERSAAWLCRRCLHAWHSLLYVHHARLHLALMHRHALYRERQRTMFTVWQAAARAKTHETQREKAIKRMIHRRTQANVRMIVRRWSGYVSLEQQCRAAVQAAMVSAYKHVGSVRPLLLNREARE